MVDVYLNFVNFWSLSIEKAPQKNGRAFAYKIIQTKNQLPYPDGFGCRMPALLLRYSPEAVVNSTVCGIVIIFGIDDPWLKISARTDT